MSLITALDKKFYPGFKDSWDNTLFREFVLARLRQSDVLLDFGAGRGALPTMNFRDRVARACGVDVDPIVTANPYLHDARVIVGDRIDYPDATFDVVVSCNVLEHLEFPSRSLAEVARVLKPGGRFLFKTPNAWHYVPLIARLTPEAFHRSYNHLRGRGHSDTFPTHYRANTERSLTELAKQAGFERCTVEFVDGRPEYLRLTAPTYLAGILYERAVTSISALRRFRVVLMGEMTKPRL
jgi:SAM-dependent methyltransferase